MKREGAGCRRVARRPLLFTRCHRGWARPCCQKRALRGRLCGSDCLCGGASGGSVPARGAPEQQHPLLLDHSAPVGGSVVLQSVFVFLAEFDLTDSDCLKREREALVREELGGANRKGAVRRKWNNIAV